MTTTATTSIDRAFLKKIGALYEPEEFEALLDRDLLEKLARAHPGLYGAATDEPSVTKTTIERRAFMSPSSSTDSIFELELENVLASLSNLSFD